MDSIAHFDPLVHWILNVVAALVVIGAIRALWINLRAEPDRGGTDWARFAVLTLLAVGVGVSIDGVWIPIFAVGIVAVALLRSFQNRSADA